MKIAVCLSGHLRNYRELKANFDGFIDYLRRFGEVDIFIATWNRENTKNSWSAAHGLSNIARFDNMVGAQEVKEFYLAKDVAVFDYDLYASPSSPLNYHLFTSNTYNWDSRAIHDDVIIVCKFLWLVMQANILKQTAEFTSGSSYDFVFRVRPDFLFNLDALAVFDLAHFEKDAFYAHQLPNGYRCDRFFFGGGTVMDIVQSSLFRLSKGFEANVFGDCENLLEIGLAGYNIKWMNISLPGVLTSETQPLLFR